VKPVFKVICFTVLSTMLFGALNGCNLVREEESGPKKVLLPWPNSSGQYSLQVVQIRTLSNLSHMEGEFGKVRVNQPKDEVPPEFQYLKRADGVLVPLDSTSTQMAASYAHIEKLGELENEIGLQGLLPRPRFLTVEANVLEDNGERKRDNASYFGDRDFIAFVPVSKGNKTLTTSLNAGIIAHEHFHALFNYLVMKKMNLSSEKLRIVTDHFDAAPNSMFGLQPGNGATPNRDYWKDEENIKLFNEGILLSAFNEGLADFWAWVYTGDPNFLQPSLPYISTRTVDGASPKKLYLRDFEYPPPDRPDLPKGEFASGYSYFLGSRFANFMKALADQEGKKSVAKLLTEKLPVLADYWNEIADKSVASPNLLFKLLFSGDQDLTKERCCLIKKFRVDGFQDERQLQKCVNLEHLCE
jgi:hypothetical protein